MALFFENGAIAEIGVWRCYRHQYAPQARRRKMVCLRIAGHSSKESAGTHRSMGQYHVRNFMMRRVKMTDRWSGGGMILQHCLFEADCHTFHQVYKMHAFDVSPSILSSKTCDDYFVNRHRDNERRGIWRHLHDHQKTRCAKDVMFDGLLQSLRLRFHGCLYTHRQQQKRACLGQY